MPSKSLTARRNPLTLRSAEPVGLASERGGRGLALADIRTDGGTQMRAGLNEETVLEYLDVIVTAHPEGSRPGTHWPFPAVVVFHDGAVYWMGDGFHRVEAARRYVAQQKERPDLAFHLTIPADVRTGARRDAILYAAGANATHGLRRTNADKRRAVEALLRDEEWGKWSDREIARRCQVHHEMVGRIRHELSGGNRQIDPITPPGEFRQIEGDQLSGEFPQMEPTTRSGEFRQIEGDELSGGNRQIERTVQRGDSVYTMTMRGRRTQQPPGRPATEGVPAGLGQTNGGRAGQRLPAGRPPLPRAERVNKLLQLYQEVLATLDEYGSLVADRAGSRYAEEVQRAITAMIAELEKEAGKSG